jgi:heme/copper-type cytochrome/quinol oxidase subunit 2
MDEIPEVETRSRRAVFFTVLGTIIVLAATVAYVWGITYKPAYSADGSADSAITTSTLANGQKTYTIHLTIQQQVGLGPHPDYLGYQTDTVDPHPGTMLDLPKNALVTIIVKNFDNRTVLRNPFFTLVQGTVGNVEYVNGKKVTVMDPTLTSHTFTIPDFGVSVPIEGISDTAPANAYVTMKFTFRTPNRTGVFSWQCIVPCGYGLYGNGGPMGEIGYMQGLFTLS